MSQVEILFLSQDDVKKCAPSPAEMIRIIEEVFRAHGQGQVMEHRVHLDLRDKFKGHFAAFPAYLETPQGPLAGLKWLGNFVQNPTRLDLPSVTAITIVNDLATGFPLAVMEGAYITAIRTAAASAVGAKYLSRKDISEVAIIGASIQGRQHLIALYELFDLTRARVFDVNAKVKQDFAQELEVRLDLAIEPASSCEEAVAGADLVVTATSAQEPFFEGSWLRSGMLLITISGVQDLKPEVLQRASKIVVDTIEGDKPPGALGMHSFFTQGLLTLHDIDATIASIVVGEEPGRQTEDEIILFSPGGLGTEDVATAYRIYERAVETGLGQRYSLL